MPTLPELVLELEAVQRAIASGVTSVSYGDKSTTYRSLNDLLRIRDELLAAIEGAPKIRRTAAGYNGGFQ